MKLLVEQCQKIKISRLYRETKSELILLRLKSRIDVLGQEIRVTTTSCHFGGKRFWFVCPTCNKRAETLYLPPTKNKLLCRKCHDLAYLKSRYHKML